MQTTNLERMWLYLVYVIGGLGLFSLIPTDKEIWENRKEPREDVQFMYWNPELDGPLVSEPVYEYYENGQIPFWEDEQRIPKCDGEGPNQMCYQLL
jgi:hypothetical protein